MTGSDVPITGLLEQWEEGDREAFGRVIRLAFDDLRQMARAHLARERSNHTLQPTALVSEVVVRILGRRHVHWENRKQFFKTCTEFMRRILIDYARRHKAARRGGGAPKVPLENARLPFSLPDVDLFALDEALDELKREDPERAEIVELKFFFGLTHEQIADILGIAPSTVKLKWSTARARLARRLQGK